MALSNHLAKSDCEVVIAEHEKNVLFGKMCTTTQLKNKINKNFHEEKFYNADRIQSPRIDQMILGPHYERINNKIPQGDIDNISRVITYSDPHWKYYSESMEAANFPVGNSSSANIAIAVDLAQKKKNVLTYIYEPLRSYTRI